MLMVFYHLFKPLGASFAPIGDRKLIGAAALLAGGGILGSALNLFGQKSANDTNLQLARENNETQKLLTRETNAMSQLQFNENMKWLREQYYDTGQIARAKEAYIKGGMNPALAYGQPTGASSVGSPSQSQFHVAQTEAGHVDPIQIGDALSESVGHSVDAYMNNQLINAQTENVKQEGLSKRIQNFTQFARDVASLRQTYADIELKLSQKGVNEETRKKLQLEKEHLDNQIKLFWTQFDALSEQPKKSNRLIDAQTNETISRTILNQVEAHLKPALANMQIRLSNAQIGVFNQQARLVAQEVITEYERGQLTNKQVFEQVLKNKLLEHQDEPAD